MNGVNSALSSTFSLHPLFSPSLGFRCPGVLVILILYLSHRCQSYVQGHPFSLLRAMMEKRSKKWMSKALCGPAFHHMLITIRPHSHQSTSCSFLFIQPSSPPSWHSKLFAHHLASNYLPSYILMTLIWGVVSLLIGPLIDLKSTSCISSSWHWLILFHQTWNILLNSSSVAGRINVPRAPRCLCSNSQTLWVY